MRVYVFEMLDQLGEVWDAADLHNVVADGVFSLSLGVPSHGVIRLAKDELFVEAEYELPFLQIEKYNPCEIRDDYFTPELKKKWEALPEAYEVLSDVATFGFKRVMPDALFASPDGRLYVYQLVMIAF